MKKDEKHDKLGLVITAIILIIAGIAFVNTKNKKKELRLKHKYTIGYVFDNTYLARGGENAYYKYYYMGKTYEGVYFGSRLKKHLSKSYIVKFNPDDPKNSEILLDKEIKGGLKAPNEGWDRLPNVRK